MKIVRSGPQWFLCCCLMLCSVPSAAGDLPPIRFGASVSLEGTYKEPSWMIQQSFALWRHEVNQKGGLLGRRVELVLYDDKSEIQQVRPLYQKLITDDAVDFVFSPYGTPLTLAASEISEIHHYVMLACAASGEIIWQRGYRYIFGIYALANRYFIGLLDMMARQGHDRISIVYDTRSPFNLDVAAGVKKWADRFQISVAHEKPIQGNEQEMAALLQELKDAGVQRLIVSAYPPDCHRILRRMQQIDYRPKILAMTIAPIHPDFAKTAGKMAEGVFAPSQWEPRERIPFPGTKPFVAAFKKFSGRMPSYHAGSAYAACQLYEEAIRQTKSLDNKNIRDFICALDTMTIIGRFKVDFSGRQIGHNPIVIQWQKGKKEIVWPSKMQTAAPLL